MSLYFIGLAPGGKLKRDIKSLKKEMSEKYKAKRALKLPAHITLQPPFKIENEEEQGLIETLETFSKKQKPFPVVLMGFGSFKPRVIFIKIPDPGTVTNLYDQLQKILKEIVPPNPREVNSVFHPHITIATRDLSRENFKVAWPEFKNRRFKDEFTAKSLILFKHNGKFWEIHREFLFADEGKKR